MSGSLLLLPPSGSDLTDLSALYGRDLLASRLVVEASRVALVDCVDYNKTSTLYKRILLSFYYSDCISYIMTKAQGFAILDIVTILNFADIWAQLFKASLA